MSIILRQGAEGEREEHGELIELGDGLTLSQNADGQPLLSAGASGGSSGLGGCWSPTNPLCFPGAFIKEDFGRSNPTKTAWQAALAGKVGNNSYSGTWDIDTLGSVPSFFGYKPLCIVGDNSSTGADAVNYVNVFYALSGLGLRSLWSRSAIWVPTDLTTTFAMYLGSILFADGSPSTNPGDVLYSNDTFDADFPAFWNWDMQATPDSQGSASLASIAGRWAFITQLAEMSDSQVRHRVWEGSNLKIDVNDSASAFNYAGNYFEVVQMAFGYDAYDATAAGKTIGYGMVEVVDGARYANPYCLLP